MNYLCDAEKKILQGLKCTKSFNSTQHSGCESRRLLKDIGQIFLNVAFFFFFERDVELLTVRFLAQSH